MFTHINEDNQPSMVSIGHKTPTQRLAIAQSVIRVSMEIIKEFKDGELQTPKGPVFSTAITAGTMAVKKCWELIPFCHPIPIETCRFDISVKDSQHIMIHCQVESHHKTGVEMEALTGASVAALTIYDMCKSMSHDMSIVHTELIHKSGGQVDVDKRIH